MKEKMTYEAAMQRLEEIVAGFERNELNLNELSERLKEAQQLLDFCQKQLTDTEKEIQKILDNGKE